MKAKISAKSVHMMDNKELRKLVARKGSQATLRRNRLEEKQGVGYSNIALEYAPAKRHEGRNFGVGNIRHIEDEKEQRKALLQELADIEAFMSHSASTLRGSKKAYNNWVDNMKLQVALETVEKFDKPRPGRMASDEEKKQWRDEAIKFAEENSEEFNEKWKKTERWLKTGSMKTLKEQLEEEEAKELEEKKKRSKRKDKSKVKLNKKEREKIRKRIKKERRLRYERASNSLSDFWSNVRKLQEEHPEWESDVVIAIVRSIWYESEDEDDDIDFNIILDDPEEFFDKINKRADKLYEEKTEKELKEQQARANNVKFNTLE